MSHIVVGINGFGTIGRRVAEAVARQPDMTLAGVAKRTDTTTSRRATERLDTTIHLCSEPEDVEPLVERSDVMIDGTPSGVGATYKTLYDRLQTPAVFQGGEDADIADASFNAYAAAAGNVPTDVRSYRVVSCNTTGLARVLATLGKEVNRIRHVDVTLVRRAGDPGETDRGPVNDIVPDPVSIPSHHAPDLNTVLPSVDVTTKAVKVPATQMHMHTITISFEQDIDRQSVVSTLSSTPRIALVGSDLRSGGAIREAAYETGRPHGSVYENCVWKDSLSTDGTQLTLMQGIHQRSDTIPETIDAVRLLASDVTVRESIERTDEALGVGRLFEP